MKTIQSSACNIIFILYLIGIIFISIDPGITNKIINTTGLLSLIIIVSSGSYRSYEKNTVILFLGLFLLGTLDLAWYGLFKTHDAVYKNAYRGYLEAGKMLLFSSFTFLLMSKNNLRTNPKLHLATAIITQLIIFSRAYYQGIYLHADRIPLSAMNGNIGQMGAATIAAYIITFCTLYSSIVFISMKSRAKWPLFYINFALSLAAIVMTGTRAAIVTLPLMAIVILFIQHQKQKVFLVKGLACIFALLLGCGLLFNKQITERINDLTQDVTSYSETSNSMSSVGARFSMILSGYKSAPDGLKWQSLEQRATKIIALSEKDPRFKGATQFLDVHMHNELAEAISTKGFMGIIFILILYATLIVYCIRERKYLLLVFPAAIMLFGLSDVITHAKPIPASWIASLFLSIAILSKKEKQE